MSLQSEANHGLISPKTAYVIDRAFWIGICLLAILLFAIFLIFPLVSVFSRSLQDASGEFVGIANYLEYFRNETLRVSLLNTIFVAGATAIICVPLAFFFAYSVTHTKMPGRRIFQSAAMLPLFAPSFLPAMSLIYLFGNQGLIGNWVFAGDIYGPAGIIVADIFFCFPHAVLILSVSLGLSDGRLYEASEALRASKWTTFRRVTLPSCRYGLLSSFFVVFTLVTTDFGIPKIIGGNYSVLSTEIYKQVVGQHNFQMGAVVGFLLLAPAVIAFSLDQALQRRHVALFSTRSVPYVPKPTALDGVALVYCSAIAAFIVCLIAVTAWGSLVTYWPYNLSLSWANYNFKNFDVSGWSPFFNSLQLAAIVAISGSLTALLSAYVAEKISGLQPARFIIRALGMLPVAVPGLVLGLGYVLFFNSPSNPLSFLVGSFALMALNTIIHFFTVPYLTALSSLRQLDREFEMVSDSLRATRLMTFWRVTLPMCGSMLLEIFVFYFINAMTTVTAVVFLYTPETRTAAIAAINMDDSGMPSVAMAMGMLILVTSLLVKVAQIFFDSFQVRHSGRWRQRL
ncbi:putative 2-aminoethylphosphonate ABC transporter permease subunit [Rhodoligotrophos defluvii]|uniref:putative 2-aminoethylphosphonate ABC transporter permease subunit n=1 Tax=Rhodoligotrophos defluvii TaxID=2561934 RepID=UPI0010C9863B|nr:putative 2-aminoethylphosphonate ABC transporter permease subunit [Rhodoligotrophos defluvii]